jgi:uncharacterized 2Fe-2S/4Fe-4S cluster protein (DUF4445 family)
MLRAEDLAGGWRLACQCTAEADLTLELAQWEAAILSDDSAFVFAPRPGLGIAIDVGTTTVVAQLVDLSSGKVQAVRSALNSQARHGADIMTRVSTAVIGDGGTVLTGLIRAQTGRLVTELCEAAGADPAHITDVVLVGNTVMHHLFAGHSLEPLSHYPFASPTLGTFVASAGELGWPPGVSSASIRFLPCIGSFVGSDILAGILATGLHESTVLTALVDLGTNGEMVVGKRGHLLCASTAAGPAFEGARIAMGMRAATGAIHEVQWTNGALDCRVIGNGEPRGICGSGLVDAAAVLLDSGAVQPNGRLAGGRAELTLAGLVRLTQTDIRELQLAKGAIAAGVRLLLRECGATPRDLRTVHLAGAFGNYINAESARRIGLLDFTLDQIHPAGNTALRGAKMALFLDPPLLEDLAASITHVGLSSLPEFQDCYVEEMLFPPSPSAST